MLLPVLLCHLSGGTPSLAFLFWHLYLQNSFLLFFTSLAKSCSISALTFLIPSLHHLNDIPVLSPGHLSSVSTGCACLSYFSVWGPDPCSSTSMSALPCLISYTLGWRALQSKKSVLKELTALVSCFAPKDSFPGHLIHQLLRHLEVYSSKAQGPDFASGQDHAPWDHKLNQGGVATAQAASKLNLSNELIILNYELETNTRSLVFDS